MNDICRHVGKGVYLGHVYFKEIEGTWEPPAMGCLLYDKFLGSITGQESSKYYDQCFSNSSFAESNYQLKKLFPTDF